MLIPQEIIKKVNEVVELQELKEDVIKDIRQFFVENGINIRGLDFESVSIVKKPYGEYKGNNIWMNRQFFMEDNNWYYGHFYLKTSDGRYLEITYSGFGDQERRSIWIE